MDAILHVGVTKTGTTTIQKFLRDNRDALSRQGFFVPASVMSRRATSAQHIGLAGIGAARGGDLLRAAWSVRNVIGKRPDIASEIRQLEEDFASEVRAASAHRTALLSSEALASLNLREAGELRSLLSGLFGKITVLVYLRRQDLHAVSRFSSALRIASPDRELFAHPMPERDRFDDTLRSFSGSFGKENMKVRLFEPARLEGGDALSDFRHVCGIEPDPAFVIPERQNEKLNAKQLAFLNRIQHASGNAPFPRKRMEEILECLKCDTYFMPARAEAEAFFRQFDEVNAWIAREFLGRDGPLFDEDFSMYPEAASLDDFLDVDDMARVLVKELDRELDITRRKRNRDRRRAMMGR
ncbi:MAG: hypothetical protein CMI62_02400 [Parvibaculum sp.]|jgi:hypothetical protein|uniref:hypothetical protein n=1 Tax=Parvibaculum sp. TaxID=2024848 RepID=UPI000C579DAC|nr:hypothetical protein [Parvibaculum sp.]MAU59562.1 hypothetical protein [Parvibaculum sp.]|tara:strand:+ start:2077 stop:3141 length:1065 start_codon:yes stop_codon:yes gene_type:complete